MSAAEWINNKFVILLSNYHYPRAVKDIDKRVKGSKDKVNVSCPAVVYEYNQYMGGVDLSDQLKVSCQVGRRILFGFLDIAVVNSKIIYDKWDSAFDVSGMKFRSSLARSMI